MAVTYGSSLQVALFVAPVLVLLGVVIGQPMDLVFTPLEVAAVAAAVGISALIALDGESNWLEGALLMLVYAILAFSFFEVRGAAQPEAHGLAAESRRPRCSVSDARGHPREDAAGRAAAAPSSGMCPHSGHGSMVRASNTPTGAASLSERTGHRLVPPQGRHSILQPHSYPGLDSAARGRVSRRQPSRSSPTGGWGATAMTRRQGIDAALAACGMRNDDSPVASVTPTRSGQEIAAHRDEFQRLCAEDVVVPTEHGTRAREAVGVAAG